MTATLIDGVKIARRLLDDLKPRIAALNARGIKPGLAAIVVGDNAASEIYVRNKMRAYRLQDSGFDTIDADGILGFGPDERRYDLAAAILGALGIRQIRLLTNNPAKLDAMRGAGIEVTGRRPLLGVITAENRRYLATKASRSGHFLDEILARIAPAGAGEKPRS